MNILIPMSGFGQRFKDAGYLIPKPLIRVDGKPIIAHIIDMFPGDNSFTFICNEDHLSNPSYMLKEVIDKYCTNYKIVPIKPHKLGPVNALLAVRDQFDEANEVIVNYCDFSCLWNFRDFLKYIRRVKCDAAIAAYKGFHPHSLGKTNYAYMKVEEDSVYDIKEKEPFTDNRMNEYAASGTFYFSSAKKMYQSFDYLLENEITVSNEYYVSLAYLYYFKNKLDVRVYALDHFMQWGTPEDVDDYIYYSNMFLNLSDKKYKNNKSIDVNNTLLITMAGIGSRFINSGYYAPKPFIPISGKEMYRHVIEGFSLCGRIVCITCKNELGIVNAGNQLEGDYLVEWLELEAPTNGQAETAQIGLTLTGNKNSNEMITIAACDNISLFNHQRLVEITKNLDYDIIVFGIRNYPPAIKNPLHYGWISCFNGNVVEVFVKGLPNSPRHDLVITGTFIFKNSLTYTKLFDLLKIKDLKVNGEYYVDSIIDLAVNEGLRVKCFEVDTFVCWGTPDELKTFEYWRNCFDGWVSHPYSITKDIFIN